MMDLVETAFRDDGVLCVEAGTGTGKTLAYLIPAVRWAAQTGEKVVISTHTISLQEQILEKDLPVVASALGIPIRAVVVKGRNNYLCRRKLAERLDEGARLIEPSGASSADAMSELARIRRWADQNEDGSRTELGFSPSFELWDEIKSDRDSCLRTKCSFHQRCFYYRMRRAAAQANILIANHHLVFADLALKTGLSEGSGAAGTGADGPDGVLPAYKRIVFDEAHHLEDVAATYFGAEVSRAGVLRTLGRLSGTERRALAGVLPSLARLLLTRAPAVETGLRATYLDAADRIESRLAPFARWLADSAVTAFARVYAWAQDQGPLGGGSGAEPTISNDRKIRLGEEPDERWRLEVQPALDRLANPPDGLLGLADELKALRKELLTGDEETDAHIAGPLIDLLGHVSALERAAQAFDLVARGEGPGVIPATETFVRWVEADLASAGRTVRMVATPIELGPLLAKHLFNANATVVMTSATLSAGGEFGYLAARLGVDRVIDGRAVTESLASPFDWPRQALVVIPTDLPAPDEEGFDDALTERVLEAILCSEGGAFVLFTSYRALNRVHDALAGRLAAAGLPVLRQGETERHLLLEKFRSDRASVLFATESFWEGVDVPGDGLRNVIITRLPFRVPTEPVLVARAERITAAGGNPFSELAVPQALLKFRQGIGRLIRTRTDRGVLVLLDTRLLTRRYGRRFLAALPPCKVEEGDSAEVFRAAKAFLGAPPLS